MTNLRHLLGANIKIYRKARGLSQEKLAEKAETATNYISAIEAGRRFPSVEMMERLATVLGVDTPELFSMKPIQYDRARKDLEEQAWLEIEKTISNFISDSVIKLKRQ